MRYLTLIRHAKASWADPDQRDHERPLNQRGLRDAPMMAAHVAAAVPRPDRILVSTAHRTQQTGTFFTDALQGDQEIEIVHEKRIYEASLSTLLETIEATPAHIKHLMLIGHNPGMAHLHSHIAYPEFREFPTCAVAHLRIQREGWSEILPGCGETVLYLTPKTLG